MLDVQWNPMSTAPRDGTVILIKQEHILLSAFWSLSEASWVILDSTDQEPESSRTGAKLIGGEPGARREFGDEWCDFPEAQ